MRKRRTVGYIADRSPLSCFLLSLIGQRVTDRRLGFVLRRGLIFRSFDLICFFDLCSLRNYQSIGVSECAIRYSLALEKCLQPKKPRYALRGEGCGAFKTKCCVSSMKLPFLWA